MTAPTQAGLCEGYGGLTMAVRAVLGARLAWYAEHEPATRQNPRPTQAASRLLAHHHPDLPNLGDLTTADWEVAPRVYVLTGGWPCQPWSLAGQRKGAEDERAIWPYVARAVRALRPRLVFLENVASIAAAGELARAAGDLAALGYVGSWRSVRASDVGAPHRRERIFILAWPAGDAALLGWHGGPATGRRVGPEGPPRGPGVSAANTEDVGHERARSARGRGDGPAHHGPGLGERARQESRDGTTPAADASRHGREGRQERDLWPEAGQPAPLGGNAAGRVLDWAGYTPAIRRWEHILGRPAPAPTVLGRRGSRQLSPLFVEWMQGLPEGHVTAVPGLTRNEQLKLLGNGVVPQQAIAALRQLLRQDRAGVAA